MSNGSGNIPKDMSLSSLNSKHIHSHVISSMEHLDKNIVDVEKDIFELQDVALQISDETLNIVHEISTIQNDFIDLQYVQSLPWFCKSNFTYQEVQPDQWNIIQVSDASNQLFIRVVELTDTYTGMFLLLPRSVQAGESRSVSMNHKQSEACVYVTSKPDESIRLTSFDLEWFPSQNILEQDIFIGHSALLSKPKKLNNYLFGSVFSSTSETNPCVVFPNSGPFYIQTIYLDNNNGNTHIVFVFQKYKASYDKLLPGFSFYGVH
jgi:hypothetical protein